MHFRCMKCGRCCRELVPIVVLTDIERWVEARAEHVLRSVVKVRAEGVVERAGVKYCYALRRERGACVFYRGGLCAIYDLRPAVCRLFPFAFSRGGLAVHPWAERNCPGVMLAPSPPPEEAEALKALAERVTRELLLLPLYSTFLDELLEAFSNRRPSLREGAVRVEVV